MTSQATDSAIFQGERFLVCGINGPDLVDPHRFGLNPQMPSTACYRGWMAEYSIGDQLLLSDLYVFHDAGLPAKNRKPNGPVINEILPQEPNSSLGFNCLYAGLNLPLQFSGGLLLGRGLIKGLLTNMGFHAFWKFEDVREVIFEGGQLRSANDKSGVARSAREHHLVDGFLGRPDLARTPEVADWIARSFSLKYDL